MNDQDIKEFANRNWLRLSQIDNTYWAAEYQRAGHTATHKASLALWQHMKSILPEWPTKFDR